MVGEPVEGEALLALDAGEVPLEEALTQWGEVPLPPYFKGRLDDPERYQTVYAAGAGSAAAPTAGLHFTPEVLGALGGRGIELAAVDLDIGVDTFRPIAVADLEDHQMHREGYSVPAETAAAVAAARERGGRVVAVGTTVVRALESAAAPGGEVRPGAGATAPVHHPRLLVPGGGPAGHQLPRSRVHPGGPGGGLHGGRLAGGLPRRPGTRLPVPVFR